VELRIPKLRKGSYFPSFLDPRRLAEKGHRGGRAGSLRPWRLDPLGRRPRARPGPGRHLQERGQPAVRGDRRQGQTLLRPPHRRRLALHLARRDLSQGPPRRACAASSSSSPTPTRD
jgi:hypothetical protein